MYLLQPDSYRSAAALFHAPQHALVFNGFAAGSSPGRLWVDDAQQPHVALLWDGHYCVYVMGDAGHGPGRAMLGNFVATQLATEAAARGIAFFKLAYGSPVWEEPLNDLLAGMRLHRYDRVFYRLDPTTARGAQRTSPPDGYRIARITDELLADRSLHWIDAVAGEIELCWPARSIFMVRGFGFCLLDSQGVVCWCTAEYVSDSQDGGQCGIGIETAEAQRGRGFATLTAGAFVDHCLAHGVTPHWDSWQANAPSVAVAEKLGFHKVADYSVYIAQLPSQGG